MRKTGQTNYVKYGELSRIKGVTTIIRADVAGKQDKLTEPQLAAVNSGITAAKVQVYDIAAGFAHSHNNKTTVLDKLNWSARYNAIYIGDEDHPINLYVYGAITAGGVGSGVGGGQGGISTIYLGSTRYDAEEGSTAIYLPAYPTQVTWANISGKPSWIGSSKPSYAFSEITGAASAAQIPSLDASKITTGTFDAARIPGLDWSKITSGKPTTIAGYGITDGVTTATLAAWTGSVNITKVGTIATGVWHGTAIGDSYIASATNWNDAYDKRHVHSNKTVLDSITAQDITDLRNLASWFGWDSTYKAVYVKKSATDEARNFYVYGAITAGGVGSGGGGSTGALYTCVDVTAYNSSKVGRDSTHPAQSGDLLAFDGNKWHAVVAPATGVTTFGGQAGEITVRGGQTANGSVNLAMSGTQLQASIVGLGSLAYKSSLSSTDVTTALGYTPYNASNPSGYITSAALSGYLPKGNGDCTGNQYYYQDKWGINLNNSDLVGLNGLFFHDTSDTDTEGVHFVRSNGNYDSIYALDGELRFAPNHANAGATWGNTNLVYHSGNLTKATLGLGNVDNTTDSVKIVARANYADVLRDPSYYDISHRRATANLNWADGGLHYFLATSSMTEGKPGGDGHILHMSWDNGSWEGQMNIPTGATNSPQWRTMNGGTWSSWMTFYHSGNSNNESTDWYAKDLNGIGHVYVGKTDYTSTNPFIGMRDSYGTWKIQLENNVMSLGYGKALNINTANNVGIGTTSPSLKLYVAGAIGSDGEHIITQGGARMRLVGSSNIAYIQAGTASSNVGTMTLCGYANSTGVKLEIKFTNTQANGNIIATGAITAGAASDARLKDNIRNLANAVTVLKALRAVEFDWNATATSNYSALKGHDVGLVAQEVEPYIPSAVGTIFGDYKRLDYTKVTPYLIAGWQNHESRIEALERENAELKRMLKLNS